MVNMRAEVPLLTVLTVTEMDALFETFIRKWNSHYPPARVSIEELHQVERKLAVTLPEKYKSIVTRFGLPSTSSTLLRNICKQGLKLSEVSWFCGPDEIIEQTTFWRSQGMPHDFVAFAVDCDGILFCFETPVRSPVDPADSPIWLFDLDLKEAREIASSFENWIKVYCEIEPIGNRNLPTKSDVYSAIKELLRLQQQLMAAFEREFGKEYQENIAPFRPRWGAIHLDSEIWEWTKHGVGLRFVEQSTDRVVDIDKYLLNLSSFDVWRVINYLESESASLDLECNYVQSIFNELVDDGLIVKEEFNDRYFKLTAR